MHRLLGHLRLQAFECLSEVQLTGSLRRMARVASATLLFASATTTATAEEYGDFSVISLNFETNATDGDVGIQAFFDADGLTQVTIKDPSGRTVLAIEANGGLGKVGFTEMFFEGMEPLIAELVSEDEEEEAEFTLTQIFELFPAGEYGFNGRTVDGEELKGTATLTTVLPAGPIVVTPQEDEKVSAGKPLVIDWEPVTQTIEPDLGALSVSSYHVIVSNKDTEHEFTIDVPADMTQVTVPAAFLAPAAEFDFEILVVEASGNQTVTESSFMTTD